MYMSVFLLWCLIYSSDVSTQHPLEFLSFEIIKVNIICIRSLIDIGHQLLSVE